MVLLNLLEQTTAINPEWQPGTGRKEYLITGRKDTFEVGLKLCQSKNTRLVQIESEAENDFVMNLVPTLSDHIWLNAKPLNGSKRGAYKHVWLDGSNFTFVSSNFINEATRPGIAIEKDGTWCGQFYYMFSFIVCERPNQLKRDTNEVIKEMRLFMADYANEAAGQNKKIALLQINQSTELAAIKKKLDEKLAPLEDTVKTQATKLDRLIMQQKMMRDQGRNDLQAN